VCVCVCIIYCIHNQRGFYPRFLFPPGVAYPLEIKLAPFSVESYVNENNCTSVSMWYSPLCKTGSTPSNAKNKIPSGDKGRDFPCTWKLQDSQGTSADWLLVHSTLFLFIAQIRFMTIWSWDKVLKLHLIFWLQRRKPPEQRHWVLITQNWFFWKQLFHSLTWLEALFLGMPSQEFKGWQWA